MDELIKRRIKEVASYIIETHSTLRDTAEHFNISKSTIHKDIKHRLMDVDFQMYKDVINIISENKMERHIRGGMQTKLNFSKNKIKGEDEQMELTKREQQIINSVKDLRSKEVALCTRQEII
jgi:putative DeoR family transcriptional regulator (stage III sporulation protein D)